MTSCGQEAQSDNSNPSDQLSEIPAEIDATTTQKKQEKPEGYDCSNFDFNSVEEQADSILAFMENAQDSTSIDRQKWEQKFFCAFPSSFEGMQDIFGYDDETGAAPLYSTDNPTHKYIDKRIFSDVIGFFSGLKSIPDTAYYTKYIRINIDGRWEADNISEAFGFHHRLISNTEIACKTLSTFSDEEIRSVFYFIFDGPHPKNEHNEEIFETLKPKIESQNKRLSNLLFEVFTTMTLREEDHRH